LVRRWSLQPWWATACSILEVGIDYSGDCIDRNLTKKAFHEKSDYAYTSCPEEARSCSEFQEAADEAFHGVRSRRLMLPLHREPVCHDSFLPWAVVAIVKLPEGQGFEQLSPAARKSTLSSFTCSYRVGLAKESSVSDLEEAKEVLANLSANKQHGDLSHCWALEIPNHGSGKTCGVVALTDPAVWGQAARAEANQVTLRQQRQLLGSLACAILAAVVAAYHCGLNGESMRSWFCKFRGSAEESQAQEAWAEEEEEEPPGSVSERIRRVRDRWGLFRASLLMEYEPLASARDLPGQRKAGM